jgi:hypothetical protein
MMNFGYFLGKVKRLDDSAFLNQGGRCIWKWVYDNVRTVTDTFFEIEEGRVR